MRAGRIGVIGVCSDCSLRRCLRTVSLSTFTTFPASLSYNLYNDELHFRDLVTFIGVWTHFYCFLSLSSFLFRFCFWINLKWSPETDNLRVQGEVPLSLQQIGGLVFPRLLKPHPRLIKKPPVRVLLRPGRRLGYDHHSPDQNFSAL